MQRARTLQEQEIFHRAAIAPQRLRAYADRVWLQILQSDLRAIALYLAQITATPPGVAQFPRRVAQMPAREAPGPAKADGGAGIADAEFRGPVSLPGETRQCVRANSDAAVDGACEMHAKERQRRVGDRVDQVLHEVVEARGEAACLDLGDEAQERAIIEDSMATVERATGQRIRGWLAPALKSPNG